MRKQAVFGLAVILLFSFIFLACDATPLHGGGEPYVPMLGVYGMGDIFPQGFPVLQKTSGLGGKDYISGYGGDNTKTQEENRTAIASTGRRPVILLHGDGGTASTWNSAAYTGFSTYAGLIDSAGYTPSHVWAISYFGEPAHAISSERTVPAVIDDVRSFIDAVLEYTGAEKVDIIALSMGVTVARAYALGMGNLSYPADDRFLSELRRLDKIGSMILMSGGNYGLGAWMPAYDWDSDGPLFSLAAENNFSMFDGAVDLTPGDVHYYCIYAEYDYLQTVYEDYGMGHPLDSVPDPINTSRLGDSAYFEIPVGYDGKNYYDDRDRVLNELKYKNHVYPIWHEAIFSNIIYPQLNQ